MTCSPTTTSLLDRAWIHARDAPLICDRSCTKERTDLMSLPTGGPATAVEVATEAPPGVPGKAIEGRSLGQIAWRRLRSDKVALAGGLGVVLFALVAVFASVLVKIYGQSPSLFHSSLTDIDTSMPYGSFGGANSTHWLGVEPVNGRDILARLIAGTRTSMVIALAATLLSLVLGTAAGLIAGYYRGVADTVLSRFMDLLLAFPTLLFSITLLAIFNSAPSFLGMKGQTLNFVAVIFVLGFFGFAYLGRIVRGQVLSIREKEFIDAARVLGATNFRIITREILPNLVGPILVWTTLTIPNYILGEAGLSYLGVGVQEPTASWGKMLSSAGGSFQNDPAYLMFPGLTLFLCVLSFNLFGDGLRDAFDPKSTR